MSVLGRIQRVDAGAFLGEKVGRRAGSVKDRLSRCSLNGEASLPMLLPPSKIYSGSCSSFSRMQQLNGTENTMPRLDLTVSSSWRIVLVLDGAYELLCGHLVVSII